MWTQSGRGVKKKQSRDRFGGDRLQTLRTDQRESLGCGQAVAGDLLEAGDDAGTGRGFPLSHPQNPLICQHHVAGHAEHHLTQLGHREEKRQRGKSQCRVMQVELTRRYSFVLVQTRSQNLTQV